MKYRDRSEMKDSGVEWLGEMPKEWEVKKLKYVSDCYPSNVNKKAKTGEKIVKLCNYTDVYYRDYITRDINFMSATVNESEIKKFALKRGDIILTKDSESPDDIAIASYVSEDIENLICGYHLTLIKVFKQYNSLYIYFQLLSTGTRNYFETVANGVTRFGIGINDFKNLLVCLPLTEKQQKIANFLDLKTAQFDSIISKKEQLIKKLEEAKKSLISEVVTGKVEIVDGKLVERKPAEMKDSGIEWLGMIPEGWEIKKIKHLVIKPLKYGVNELAETDNINLPRYIRITDFTETDELKEDTFKSLEYKKARGYMLNEGDILFARSGATVGKTFQFKGYNGEACFAGYLIKATVNEKISKSDFLYYFTKSLIYENWKNRIFIQATIQNISADKYKELKLAIPPMHEQNNICDYVRKNNNKYMNLEGSIKNQIQKLKQAKQSLISEVVTGKIDLRDWEIVEPA